MQQKTKLCPHCKKEIDFKASRCSHCQGKIYIWTTGRKVLAGFVVFTVILLIFTNGSKKTENIISNQETRPTMSAAELAKWKGTPAGKLCAKHSSWTKEDCDKLIADKIWIGMTYDMLIYSHGGKPNTTNPSNYGGGIKYQYCWSDYTPSCYYDNNDDGVIDAYN